MYTTVSRYLAHVHAMNYPIPHDVNNPRTWRCLIEHKDVENWDDLRNEVLTPDLTYLIDVLDRADFVVAKIDDIFDWTNAEFIYKEAVKQECDICTVTKHAGYIPNEKLRDTALNYLQDLCREKLLDKFVTTLSRSQTFLTKLRVAYRDRTDETLVATDVAYHGILRCLRIRHPDEYETADFVTAVDKYLASSEASAP